MKYIEMIIPLIGLSCILIITCSIALVAYSKYLETERVTWHEKEIMIQECKNMGFKR